MKKLRNLNKRKTNKKQKNGISERIAKKKALIQKRKKKKKGWITE